MRNTRTLPAVLLGVVLVLTACSSDDTGSAENEPEADTEDIACGLPDPDPDRESVGDGGFPVTVTDDLGEVTLEETPERIVSLSPSHTEILFAIGAGDQVEAVDEYSYYPEEAPVTDLSGYEPNVEAITEFDPDLVVFGGSTPELKEQLEAVDIPAVVVDAAPDLEDAYAQMRLFGDLTGNPEEADAEADRVESEVNEIVDNVCAETDGGGASFYHELDDTLFSATSETFIGQIYAAFGLANIADAADDGAAGGYPQLSTEYVVEEDADLIFLAYGDENTAEEVAERPAFDTVTAVQNDAVYLLDEDIASRWGPRVVDLTQDVADAVLEQTGA